MAPKGIEAFSNPYPPNFPSLLAHKSFGANPRHKQVAVVDQQCFRFTYRSQYVPHAIASV